jgi:murein L,D-transpeptidase YcbB/YkuD
MKQLSSFRIGFGALALALALPATAQEHASLRLDLNIPELVLRVYEGDRLLKSYPVSVGLPGHATPAGDFTVTRAEWNPWWRPPAREWAKDDKITPPGPNNPMGRVKLFFAPLYYLHGTPHEKDLGSPASHGCVRMKNADVIALGRLLHERAEPTFPGSEITAVLARSGSTRVAGFRAPVPLTIRYEPIQVVDGELRIFRDIYRRGRIHSEGVYQALMAAGYDPTRVPHADVTALLRRARASSGKVFVSPIDEALPTVRMVAR